MIKQAVILAGGQGTRLQPFTNTAPKPMYTFDEIPFLEYLVLQVKGFEFEKVILLLGYLPEVIKDYFGDGSRWGIQISYNVTPVSYDTGDRLRHAKRLFEKEFLLLYCDNYCPINIKEAYRKFKNSEVDIQITCYANKDNYTKSNVLIKEDKVIVYDKSRKTEGLQGVDIGYSFIKRDILNKLPESNVNFEGLIYPYLVEEGAMGAYVTEHRYYSVGSWERIELTKEFFRHKKVIFLDRDGTLNEKAPKAEYICNVGQFKWLPQAKEALVLLSKAGYEIYIITNQPGIARNMVTEENLDAIHDKIVNDLKEIDVSIQKIYTCKHGWDDGCECRKPRPGMLFQAQKENSLNLSQCIVVGDDERDVEAGNAAGCKSYLLAETENLYNIVKEILNEDGN